MLKDPASIALAAFFSFLGISISIYQILCHLRNYTEPVFQRYIIRIIFMVPVYAIGSFCSLQWRHGAIYFDTLRDCYEAWIIYNFSALLLAYVGGPGAVVVKAEGKVVHPSWSHMTCCLPAMQVDGFFLRRCKQGTVQFVLLKPVMAALTLILYAAGAYTDGDMSPTNGYFYLSILYNVCYTMALYGLILFWIGAAELLQPFNPLLKFVLVKTVVFLTFWQGIGISCINSMGKISDPEDGKALQNFMICTEMAVAGIALLYAFPHKEYQIGGSTNAFRLEAFKHAISINDVVKDAIHVFAPSYSDYVLYSDGGPADNVKRKKFRGQKGTGADHPKAGKPMTKVEEPAGADNDGRRSRTPNGGGKMLEANRNQAILLDSDSDGMDSDDEGSVIGGMELDDEQMLNRAASAADGSFTACSSRIGSACNSVRPMPRQTGGNAGAADGQQLQKRTSSRRVIKRDDHGNDGPQQQQQGQQQQQQGQADDGLIKASYPAGLSPASDSQCAAGRGAAKTVLLQGTSRRALPIALQYKGAILSDSDSDDDDEKETPAAVEAAAGDKAGLLGPGHVGSESADAAAQVQVPGALSHDVPPLPELAAAARPVVLVAPPSRGKAAAVRQAVAGTAQAAGRAMAAAQAAGSRQAGSHAVVPSGPHAGAVETSRPIVLTPPKRAAFSAAAAVVSESSRAAGGPPPRSPAEVPLPLPHATTVAADRAAATSWEPSFPQDSAAAAGPGPERQQQDAQWAERGWSNVAL